MYGSRSVLWKPVKIGVPPKFVEPVGALTTMPNEIAPAQMLRML